MPGVLCLQGGREFTPACIEMDRDVIATSTARHVAVLAGAARVGSDYDGASTRARRHYAGLDVDVAIVPDPRTDLDAAFEALSGRIDLLVLPGGSPSSLLDVLSGPVRDRLVEMYAAGTAISGASAGAMVMCSHMARPDRRRRRRRVGPGRRVGAPPLERGHRAALVRPRCAVVGFARSAAA